MDLYIYLYINFRSIVLFSDGKISDRKTNNSFNSLIQSRSFIQEILVPLNSDCSWSNHWRVCVGCDKFLIWISEFKFKYKLGLKGNFFDKQID